MLQQCRIINLTVALVIVLSIYNLLLTIKLLSKEDCEKDKTHAHNTHQDPMQRYQFQNPCPDTKRSSVNDADDPFAQLNLRVGRWDNRLLYKYYDHILVGDRFDDLSRDYNVCLATQSSLDKLYSLVEVSSMWHGPISVALFAVGEDELNALLLYVIYLRQCYDHVKQRVAFHLALPKHYIPEMVSVEYDALFQMDCNTPEATLQQLMLKRVGGMTSKRRQKNPYPQNHLRNLARKNCNSEHVFLTDVDIIPSHGFVEKLDMFLKSYRCAKKCAYVVPTYELDTRVKFPSNKSELVRLANKGLARPFHHRVFIYNQYATNFTKWQSNVQADDVVRVSHNVTNFEFLYEPFYVAVDTVPPHDERFIGYGYTRNTQVYEMFVAEYEFLVLSPIFTVHWGLQVKRTRPPWREHQNNQNRKLFETFKREVFARYKKDPLHMIPNLPPG